VRNAQAMQLGFLQPAEQKVFHRLRGVFEKRFSSFLKRVAFAGSRASRGIQRTHFGLFWQIPGWPWQTPG
jgi:hypothetical protein